MLDDKKLKKMSRGELLELLVLLSQQNDELQKQVKEKEAQLENRQIIIKEAGSIAEASLKLNKVFEIAQKAADEYLDNIRKLGKRKTTAFKIIKNRSNTSNKNK